MSLPNLRRIFASSRTPEEEAQISRSAFFKFSGYILTCAFITWVAAKQGAHLRLGAGTSVSPPHSTYTQPHFDQGVNR
ncbi:hypothetical protein BG006_002257 [Podila minutissima]|uniref:Uncharacterized protein n=1 Tax=Podila minutissima TaxID=64525 RepID=A0A9P5SC80_9FUNG|nr:hypothetical protein BG006_002257 [Podila minutissima]